MIAGGIFLVLFVFSGYWLLIGRKENVNNKNEQIVPSEAIIPTVNPINGKKRSYPFNKEYAKKY